MRQILTVKKNQMLDKKSDQETVKELIQQQEMSWKSNSIIVQTDNILSTEQRSLFAIKETENKSKKQFNFNRHKSQMNDITSRLEALILSMNVMKNAVNQQSKILIMC